MKKKPPFQITPLILSLCEEISRELGILFGAKLPTTPLKLRRENKIKTIQSSLAIEGNTLSVDQISDILDGKAVIGPKKDILEVRNAIQVYEMLPKLDPLSISDFKKAHKILMHDLVEQNGIWRTTGVAIFSGKLIAHVAPPAKIVPELMEQLFAFIKGDKTISWIIKACVFHYELEFVHPFADGNGRMGRLWQQLLLMKIDPLFELVSVETIIKDNQQQYYEVLTACDKAADSTLFIEFSLTHILTALRLYAQSTLSPAQDFRSRLLFFQNNWENSWFTRKEYLFFHKDISSATASRDLITGVKERLLIKKGEKNQVMYRFVK